jgi:hypothetical protein
MQWYKQKWIKKTVLIYVCTAQCFPVKNIPQVRNRTAEALSKLPQG